MSTMLERATAAGIPIHEFDLEHDPRWGVDPHAVWDEATKIAPLFYSPVNRGYFVATDYETVKGVLRDTAVWANTPTTTIFTEREVRLNVPPLSMDAPDHTVYRRAMIPLFSPQVLTPLEPGIYDLANELVDDIFAKGSCLFTKDFSSQLPARFFLGWFGFDYGDMQRMFELAEKATFEFPTPEIRKQIEGEIEGLISGLYEYRRTNPGDDLATAMVNMRVNGEPIPEEVLVPMGTLAFIAGQETTSTQLGYIMWHLARFPKDRRRLIDDPALIPDAIEELMRVYNTGGPSGRTARASGDVDGVQIEAGDRIFIARAGADRAMAADVQLDRTPNRHTAFGLGIHRCIGSHIARIEMRIALEVWLKRVPEFSIPAGFVPTHRYGSFMQQLNSLPLEIPGLGSPHRAAA
ncbi:MAG: cytochrome [Subtercola sp.]|nr:cytochrome [Subtercola sp.]